MGSGQELSGDYGYDMAHQDIPAARPADQLAPARDQGEAPVRSDSKELDRDLSYDTSHDF